MSRTIQDQDFLEWEVYASAGDFGFSERAHVVFDCLTDRSLRPRYVEREGDKADAERVVATASDAELAEMLAEAEVVD